VRIEYEGALFGFQRTYTAFFGGVPFQIHEHHRRARYRGDSSSALGYRIDFPLNDSLQNWGLVAGAAYPTDPNGLAVPLDYNATNNKHWAKIGGF
jgi:hypothetical protein